MKFRTPYSPVDRSPSPSGSRYLQKYAKSFNSDGVGVLSESGVEDVYDSIQKAALGICLEDLIRRARAGDSTAIPSPVNTGLNDVSKMPTDILAAHSFLNDARNRFLTLPKELRSKFGNSFERFIQAAGDGSLFKPTLEASASPSGLTPDEISAVRSIIGGNNNA